jgi:Nup85 Nucleoporin
MKAIVRVPLEEQAQVDQLVDLCLDLHLDSQRTDICQAWARKLEGSNQVGLALTYFEKGQGFSDIERICWDHFERLLLTGRCHLYSLLISFRRGYLAGGSQISGASTKSSSNPHDGDIDRPTRVAFGLLRA